MTSPSDDAVPGVGHNSAEALRDIVDRLGAIDEQMRELRECKKDLYAECKGEGFDPAVVRRLMSLLQKDKQKLTEHNELLRVYGSAVGFDPFS